MVVHLPSEPHLLKFAPGAPVSSLAIQPNLQIVGYPPYRRWSTWASKDKEAGM